MNQAATTTSGHSPRQLKTSPETGRSQSSCGRSVRRSNADAPHPPSLLSSGQPPLQTSTAPTETPVPYTTPAALPGPLVWPFHMAPLPPLFPSNQTPLVGYPIIEVRSKPFFVFCNTEKLLSEKPSSPRPGTRPSGGSIQKVSPAAIPVVSGTRSAAPHDPASKAKELRHATKNQHSAALM